MKSRMLLAAIAMSFGLVSYATVMPTVAWTNNLDTVQNGYAITLGDGCAFSNGAAVVGSSGGISIDIDNMPTAVSVLVKYRNCKPQPTSAVVISAAVQSTYGDTSHEIGVRSDGGNTNNVTGYWQVGANYPFGSVALPEFGYILFSLSALHGTGVYVGSNISSLIGGINSTLKFSNTGAYRITIGAATGTKANVTYSSWDGLMVEQVAVFENSYLSPADVQSHFFAENPVTGESVAYSYKYVGGGTWNAEDWIAPDNEYPDSAPALSGSNLWYPIVIDDGQTVTAGNVEGWTLQLGLYNGSSLTIPSLFKWQGGCSVCVDKDSQLTISSLGEGTYGDDVNFYVAAPTGITYGCDYDKNGASFYYHFAEDGSVLYQNLNGGSHTIKTADIYLSGAETKTLKSKELVAFESSSINFAANATIKVKYGENEIYQVQISSIRSDGVSLTADGDVGECELVQTSSGIYLYYVDGKPDSKDKYAIAAWKNGDEIESSAGCFDIGFGSTLNLNGNVFDEDGNILISGDKGVLLDWADALSNMTIFVWCSMPCINENSALATIARQGYSDDIIGVSLATNAMTSGIWLGAPFLNATSSSAASVGNDVCFALAYQNFFEQFPCGTELYEFIDGSMTKIYSSIPLRSIGFFNGCAIGGARTSENFASLAGMKISAVAVYDECLDPSQIWSVVANGAQKIPSNDMIGDGASLVMAKVSNVAVRQHSPWEGVICLDFSIDCDDNVIDVPITINVRDNESGCLLPIGTIYFDGVAMGSHSLSAKHGDHHVVLDVAEYNPRYDSGMVLVEVAIDEFYSRYMVVDLSSGPEGAKYPVHFIDEVPPEGWSEEYKTTNMVLRLVESGAFQMGCGPSETGYFGEYEATPHIVELTKPFYMGVFEVTQRQFELIAGTNTSSFVGAMRPVDSIPMTMIRGEASNFGGNWPMDNYVAKDSFVGRMRIKTGIGSFDLPTEAEWEYACRAGTTSALNSGKDLSDENMAEVGRFHGNDDDGQYTSTVGNYMPNAWGLYDMHGNIWEWCLDWYQNGSSFSTNSVIDPLGPSNGNRRVARGGAWISGARVCRSAHREGWLPTIQYPTHGMRVRCYRSNVVGDYASEISSGLIELKKQTHIVSCGEMVHVPYSPEWLGAESCTLSVDGGVVLASNGPGEFAWTPNSPGIHMLTLASGDVHMNTIFRVLPANVVLVRSEEITNNVLWDANNVYVIDGILRVASGAVLTIPSGTIVKLVEGSAVVVEPGGCCIARGAIFTHIADDSVGGDTMGDGDGTVPGYGQYSIDDAVVGDDKTELRYLDSVVYVGGVLSGDVVWWGRRVYRITSNVDVPVDSRLTVLPGTILKFDPGTRMNVYGALDVQGTRYAPVVFTSIKDDKFGGDTNCDSDNSYPEGGDWDGVWVYGGKADMKYASLLYSGSINERGAVQAFNSKGLYDNSNNTFPNAEILMDCCEIAHSKFDGIVNVTGGNISVTNTVIHDVNWATGPFSGPTNEYVNCVFYGNSVGLCYWENGRWRGKPVYKNCVFANCINGWCERALNVYGDPSQEVTILNCLFWNEPGFGSDACNRIGSDGNIWGDPKFEDADNGDFRIQKGSPCINAGDSNIAPEFDYYGQPRYGVADIGIYEMTSGMSVYDLAAVAVNAQAARSTIGETFAISYDIANVGRLAVADQWHDALYLVSSSSGKMYALGEPLNPGSLGVGETRTFTLQFKMPVVPVGSYRLRLVVNSRRMDVPEGTATENNVVLSDAEIEVVADSIDASDGASGSVAAGASSVCAFSIPEGAGDKLLRIKSVAGGTTLSARCGLGFLPVDATSGTALSFSGGEAWLSVPAGTEKVWLVLDNDGTSVASYDVEFHDCSLALLDVSPSNIPSSGEVTLEISGAGFTDGCEVSFVGAGTVAPLAVRRVSSGLLVATVDASSFAAGGQYAVTITKNGGAKTLESALTVAKAAGKPKFWAKLDVPDSMRQGRLMQTCFVEYGNSGTADMPSPVLQVSMTGDGTLGYIGGLSGLKTLQFVAAGDAGSAGVLRAGSSHRIRFEIRAGASNKISLHTSEGSTYAPAPWTNAADYLADLSAAATRVGNCGLSATDYAITRDIAERTLTNNSFSIVSGILYASDGERAKRCFLTLSASNNVYHAQTDDMGCFCFDNVQSGEYVIASQGVGVIEGGGIFVCDGADVVGVELRIGSTENCALIVEGFDSDHRVSLSNATTGDEYFFDKNIDAYSVSGLPYGRYTVAVTDGSGGLWRGGFTVDDSSGKVVLLAERERPSSIVGVVDSPIAYPGRVVLLSYSDHCEYQVLDENQTCFSFDGLPSGYYTVEVFLGNDDEILHETIDSFYLDSGMDTNLTFTVAKKSSLLARTKAYSVHKLNGSYGDKYHWWEPNAVQDMFLDYLKEFEDEWFANRVYRPAGEYACEHNLAKYERDAALWQSYQELIIKYHQGATKTSAWKFLADCSWLIHKIGDLTWDAFMHIYCKGTTTVYKMAFRDVAANIATFTVTDFAESELVGKDGHKITEQELSALNAAIQSAANASGTIDDTIKKVRFAQYSIQNLFGENMWSKIGYHSKFMKGSVGKVLAGLNDVLTFGQDFIDTYYAGKQAWDSMNELDDAMDQMEQLTWLLTASRIRFNQQAKSFNQYPLCCNMCYPETPYDPPVDNKKPSVPKSCDPNEMVGDEGVGEARYVKPGDWMNYTIYFENKAGFNIADAQEIKVTNPLNEWLDWSTFEMREVAFNNQNDVGLDGLATGTSEVQMIGTNKYVRTTVECDAQNGVVAWYMRVYDPNGDIEGFPTDGSGFLPSNDDTHRGEGYIKYRIKVRDDAPANVVITNLASIVFDYNDPIETDPAWWNTVAPTVGTALFAEPEIVADEGSNVVVRVSGGNMYSDSSVKLYLTYNTAAAADVDIAKGMINGVTPKGGLKFPLTLSWESGEMGEKVVTIPVKTDKAIEDDEFFTLQLAAPQGMSLGDATVCTVTINDPGYDELAGKIAAGTATKAEQTAWDKLQKAKAPYIRGLADTAECGKVTGSGLCAPGKKVTLKATANKDFVFMGWSQGAGNGESASAEAAADKQGTDNGFVARTASLVIDRTAKPAANSATSTTLTGITEDSTFFANFITSAEDKASVTAGLNGTELLPDEGASPFSTNVWAGVYLEWPVAADALSQTTVKVSGLPSGLKFTAKPVTSKIGSGKTAVVVTNVPANTIYGAPTAASKVGRDGSVAPYQVKITVTTAGKSSVTYLANIIVDPLPAWAVGTFDGALGNGSATMSVTSVGKVSGKLSLGGTNWTFKADYYAMNGGNAGMTNFTVVSEAVAGKATMPIALTLSDLAIGYLPDTAAAAASGTFGDIASTLYRVVWADKGDAAAAALVASCAGAYSFKAAYGDTTGAVAFTLDEKGAIKGAVVLPDGAKTRKASFSANALAEPNGLHVVLSLPPDAKKGYPAVFEDRVLVGCSGAADDSHVFRDPGVIVVTAPLYGASDASGSVAVSPKYGQVAEGKTVTLKVTPAKNCVFVGWYDGETLLSQAASYSCAATGADMTFAAKFVTTEEDRRNVVLSVNGMTVSDDEAAAPYRGVVSTNITCGIALNWPIDASALSATTVKVAGLPAGLKFDSRTNVIFGTPTAAKAGDVKITVTTAGKTSVTYLLKLTVDPLPDWVVGQFYGIVNCHGDLSLSGDLWENTSIAEISISKDGKVNACSREANNYLWKDATTLYVDDAGVYRFDIFHVNGMEWWRERFSVSAEPVSDGGTPLGCIVGEEEGVDWGGSPFVSNWRAIQDAYSAKPIGLPLPKFNTNDAICRFNVHAVSSRFDWIAEDGMLTLKFSTNGAVTPTWSGETQFKMIGAHLTPYHVDDKGTVSAMLMVQGVDKAKGCAIGLYCVLAIPCEANGNAKASEVELTAETVIIDCL